MKDDKKREYQKWYPERNRHAVLLKDLPTPASIQWRDKLFDMTGKNVSDENATLLMCVPC